jgi:DNA-binding MarR family transcriptional regulator
MNEIKDENNKFEALKLDNQFCFSVYTLAKEMNRIYKPYLKELDLTYTQYITMLVLWEKDGLKVNEIGKKLQLDSGTLTPLLKKLEQKGYLKRKRMKGDERNLNVTLTPKGKELREKAVLIPKELVEKISLPLEKIIQLREEFNTINSRLAEIE